MEKVVKPRPKLIHKIELYSNKIIPIIIAGFYFSNTVLSYFGIDFEIFSWIAGVGILAIIKFYVSSYAYQFCEYHRMPLHYIVVNSCITAYDYYIGIPVSNRTLFTINCVIAFLAIVIAIYLKVKVCKNH